MSVSAHYDKLIDSSYNLIQDKQAENEDLARQEAEQEKLLSQEKEKLNLYAAKSNQTISSGC